MLLKLPLDVPTPRPTWPADDAVRALRPRPRRRRTPSRELADAIAAADRPVIVAGRGAVLAGAREPLIRLSGTIGAPVATSAMGHGIFNGHPFALGISGGFASPLAAEAHRREAT